MKNLIKILNLVFIAVKHFFAAIFIIVLGKLFMMVVWIRLFRGLSLFEDDINIPSFNYFFAVTDEYKTVYLFSAIFFTFIFLFLHFYMKPKEKKLNKLLPTNGFTLYLFLEIFISSVIIHGIIFFNSKKQIPGNAAAIFLTVFVTIFLLYYSFYKLNPEGKKTQIIRRIIFYVFVIVAIIIRSLAGDTSYRLLFSKLAILTGINFITFAAIQVLPIVKAKDKDKWFVFFVSVPLLFFAFFSFIIVLFLALFSVFHFFTTLSFGDYAENFILKNFFIFGNYAWNSIIYYENPTDIIAIILNISAVAVMFFNFDKIKDTPNGTVRRYKTPTGINIMALLGLLTLIIFLKIR